MKIHFENDYSEGMHEAILEKVIQTNRIQTIGYGEDEYCINAKKMIRSALGNNNYDVHFLMGGTQANLTVISSILRPWQGVISADTGHINVHETGAIEATGHKVLTLPNLFGKCSAHQIKEILEMHGVDPSREHTVEPGMVYISHPTETGVLYTKKELEEISSVCRDNHIPLYLDGARILYGLSENEEFPTLNEIAKLCDVFYIGGTKAGAIMGEAVVITNDLYKKDFRYGIKQRGGMMAKGRFLGIQFCGLFEQDLYKNIGKTAVHQAERIKNAFAEIGIGPYFPSFTNQQFFELNSDQIEKISKEFTFTEWERLRNGNQVVRFCTSWATKEEDVDKLIGLITKLKTF